MRFLIVDTYYPQFLKAFYATNPGLRRLSYREHWKALMRSSFGTADFYSEGLVAAGHEGHEVVANCLPLQGAWTREHAPTLWRGRWVAQVPRLRRQWQEKVLRAQVEWYKPDVLFVQNIDWMRIEMVESLRKLVDSIVAQHATVLHDIEVAVPYDLVFTSVPMTAHQLESNGIKAIHLKLGFGSPVLDRLEAVSISTDVVHVGSYGALHAERNEFLEFVARRVPCEYWGSQIETVPKGSALRNAYRGPAWGLDMYRKRAQARMTLTKHITLAAGNDVANCTMYETTGVGSCLVVDHRSNLATIFDPDNEVVGYGSHEEAIEKILYLLDHETERASIAAAGKRRTLAEHTYNHRMKEMVSAIEDLTRSG